MRLFSHFSEMTVIYFYNIRILPALRPFLPEGQSANRSLDSQTYQGYSLYAPALANLAQLF